jgi:hypothetical protein
MLLPAQLNSPARLGGDTAKRRRGVAALQRVRLGCDSCPGRRVRRRPSTARQRFILHLARARPPPGTPPAIHRPPGHDLPVKSTSSVAKSGSSCRTARRCSLRARPRPATLRQRRACRALVASRRRIFARACGAHHRPDSSIGRRCAVSSTYCAPARHVSDRTLVPQLRDGSATGPDGARPKLGRRVHAQGSFARDKFFPEADDQPPAIGRAAAHVVDRLELLVQDRRHVRSVRRQRPTSAASAAARAPASPPRHRTRAGPAAPRRPRPGRRRTPRPRC